MTLEEYLKENRISIKKLSDKSEIPYTTIGDIVKGRTDIDNASIKVLMGISQTLGLSLDQTYSMAKMSSPTPKIQDGYLLSLKNGKYYISFGDNKEFLCNNNRVNSQYIKDIAATFIKNKQRKERMDTWKEIYLDI